MDEQQRNLFIAIALSLAILFGFQYFLAPHPKPEQPAQQQQQQAQQQPAPQAPSAPAAPAEPAPSRAAPGITGAPPASAEPRATVLAAQPRATIATPRLNGSVDLQGARFDDLTLSQYHETVNPKSPEIVLLAPDGSEHPYFAELGWVASDPSVRVPTPETKWTSSGGDLTPDHPIDLTWDNGAGLTFGERISIDDQYMFSIATSVENHGAAPVTLYPYGLVQRVGEVENSSTYLLHEGPVGVFDNTLQDGIKYDTLKSGEKDFSTTGGWMGFTDKYWLVALIPDQQEQVTAKMRYFEREKTDAYQVDYRGAQHVIAPGQTVADTSRVFAGAKEVALLDHYTTMGIPRFDRAIDFGWFYFLTKPIFLTLGFFYHLIGNFGLAIMLLTVLIKAVFFPLANKSYRAMSKMKQLQPEMQKLRERFGDDKQRLNQEMMALYKRVGANPMAGCLPIVIQIPVFFSLYKVLYVTIEMRHAPFYGWIHDLSAPDPTSFVNLFGLLPFAPPDMSFLHIGAWPLIMGCTMFLQQKLNPQPPDPIQAKMFMILPVVFTVMLAPFPAGLVIYWSWNNLLSIAQQWVIMRGAKAQKK
jgi:YidC/Oxa1 family membrane protein insertase